ncbi:hypothetical protein CIRG_06444 [Coccidioides immitis RMSCC 2394]|uniref:Asteroid domain-containing protein n=1 Tax=Coccidioides immitis RMSCC 2394 TaxID=404692 RepID=A0A0J6YIL2_COCIT|nr:hypothetical protein CIRG_06444 [Coccidioides immitis RMSCC 2394]
MGIPHLARHLLPHAEVVWLGDADVNPKDGRQITSVVIDGPALVYHVYYSLLSRMPPGLNAVAAQPTSNEVSIGVMRFLFQLMELNVAIKKICFDGGLPLSKRDTRLERLEMSRRKLETFNGLSDRVFRSHHLRRRPLDITAHMVFNKRGPQAGQGGLPENPFMVQTVIEDLKTRWNGDAVAQYLPHAHDISRGSEYIWGNITELVPGEADKYCAHAAKQFGAAVLTGDSDLLVHDLGQNGTVIFFSSIESNENDVESGPIRIRATEICPKKIAKNLGVSSVQRFAFELKRDPYLSLGKVVQRAKENIGGVESNDSYISFVQEYASLEHPTRLDQNIQLLDPRVSELYLQYMCPEFGVENEQPVIYLPIMVENHFRRCAWREGSEIRAIAFSIFNLLAPPENRKNVVLEYSRRGTRVVPTSIHLLQEHELRDQVPGLYDRLKAVLDNCGDSLLPWRVFAMQEVFLGKNEDTWPSPGRISKFLETGRCAETMDWEDIHLNAQIQSILYSLRMLRQSLEVSVFPGELGLQRAVMLLQLLRSLPPMRVLSHSMGDMSMSEPIPNDLIKNAVAVLFSIREQNEGHFPDEDINPKNASDDDIDCVKKARDRNEEQPPKRLKKTNNPYEMLEGID